MGYWLADENLLKDRKEIMMLSFKHYNFFSVLIIDFCRLTNTPRKTSGHGWTLVNVGFTMAIAILDEKWVRGEK